MTLPSKMLIHSLGAVAARALLLFVPAGTLAWAGAWFLLAEEGIAGTALGFWLNKRDPELLAQRLSPPLQRRQAAADRILLIAVSVCIMAWMVVMALDAARFGWSQMPWPLSVLGAAGLLACRWIRYLTFRENSYAAPVVKIQRDRGHRVASTGLYRHIRHPLYMAEIVNFVATPLLLGSWLGFALVPALVLMLTVRTLAEERTLERELEGYVEYAARVRYRFVPLIW